MQPSQLKVSLFDEIAHILGPVVERGACHVQQLPCILGQGTRSRHTSMLFKRIFKFGEGIRPIRVEALHECCIDLDLLKLIAIYRISIARELFFQGDDAIGNELPFAISLGLGRAVASANRLPLERRRGAIGCGHRMKKNKTEYVLYFPLCKIVVSMRRRKCVYRGARQRVGGVGCSGDLPIVLSATGNDCFE